MPNFPTLEPVIVDGGSFVIERLLDRQGTVEVGVGDKVTADQVIARSENLEQSVTLYVSNELGVEREGLQKYLAKSIGSEVKAGEVVARVRRGLRTATVKSPVAGTLSSVDEANGTVVLSAALGPRQVRALVNGEVEQVVPGRGAVLRSQGTRIYGILGFGSETSGPLVVGIERDDRELTSDRVSNDWRGSIVLAGMTAGVPALTRMKEAGVAGVIMGSVSEADIRRFLTNSGSANTSRPGRFWNVSSHPESPFCYLREEAPFVIIVTEGFGRSPMADEIFQQLRQREGRHVTLSASTSTGTRLARPEIYITGNGSSAGTDRFSDELHSGRRVRIANPSQPGVFGTCQGEPYFVATVDGVKTEVADVALVGGDVRSVPVSNLEVII